MSAVESISPGQAELPVGWDVVKFGDVCSVLAGNAWRSPDFNRMQKGLPVIRIQNVGARAEEDFMYWDRDYDSKYIIEQGDILLTLSGKFPKLCLEWATFASKSASSQADSRRSA